MYRCRLFSSSKVKRMTQSTLRTMNDAIDTALAQHEYKTTELAKRFNEEPSDLEDTVHHIADLVAAIVKAEPAFRSVLLSELTK